jgi:phosphoribosylaminoimidazole carboxylase
VSSRPNRRLTPLQRGVPTLTVGINNSTNAALGAIRVLGSFMPGLQDKMIQYQKEMEHGVHEKDDQLVKIGYGEYLKKLRK